MADDFAKARSDARVAYQLGEKRIQTESIQTNLVYPVYKFPFDNRLKIRQFIEIYVNGVIWLKRGWIWETTEDFNTWTHDEGTLTENDEIKSRT